jgi:hypothetical protein
MPRPVNLTGAYGEPVRLDAAEIVALRAIRFPDGTQGTWVLYRNRETFRVRGEFHNIAERIDAA